MYERDNSLVLSVVSGSTILPRSYLYMYSEMADRHQYPPPRRQEGGFQLMDLIIVFIFPFMGILTWSLISYWCFVLQNCKNYRTVVNHFSLPSSNQFILRVFNFWWRELSVLFSSSIHRCMYMQSSCYSSFWHFFLFWLYSHIFSTCNAHNPCFRWRNLIFQARSA